MQDIFIGFSLRNETRRNITHIQSQSNMNLCMEPFNFNAIQDLKYRISSNNCKCKRVCWQMLYHTVKFTRLLWSPVKYSDLLHLPSGYATKASPGPASTTSSTSWQVCLAMKPITEKITKPANTLVPQLMKATSSASLKYITFLFINQSRKV